MNVYGTCTPFVFFPRSPQNVYNYLVFLQIIMLLNTYFLGLSLHPIFRGRWVRAHSVRPTDAAVQRSPQAGDLSLLPVSV